MKRTVLFHLLSQSLGIFPAKFLKGSVVKIFPDFFQKSVVKIQIVLHRQTPCKLFAAFEQVPDV